MPTVTPSITPSNLNEVFLPATGSQLEQFSYTKHTVIQGSAAVGFDAQDCYVEKYSTRGSVVTFRVTDGDLFTYAQRNFEQYTYIKEGWGYFLIRVPGTSPHLMWDLVQSYLSYMLNREDWVGSFYIKNYYPLKEYHLPSSKLLELYQQAESHQRKYTFFSLNNFPVFRAAMGDVTSVSSPTFRDITFTLFNQSLQYNDEVTSCYVRADSATMRNMLSNIGRTVTRVEIMDPRLQGLIYKMFDDYIDAFKAYVAKPNSPIHRLEVIPSSSSPEILAENPDVLKKCLAEVEKIKRLCKRSQEAKWFFSTFRGSFDELFGCLPLCKIVDLFSNSGGSNEGLVTRVLNRLLAEKDTYRLTRKLLKWLKSQGATFEVTQTLVGRREVNLSDRHIIQRARRFLKVNGSALAKWEVRLRGDYSLRNRWSTWVRSDNASEPIIDALRFCRLFFDVPVIDEPDWAELAENTYDHDDLDALLSHAADDLNKILGEYSAQSGYRHRTNPAKWGVEDDGSLSEGGVEIRSPFAPPLTVPAMLDSMYKLFTGLSAKDYSADTSCGLHVSFSRKDKGIEETDMVKLVVLLGDSHILRSFDRHEGDAEIYARATQRDFKRWVQGLESYRKDRLIQLIKKGDTGGIAAELSGYGFYNHHASVNIDVNPGTSKNRVEFRQMGNQDYITKFDEIENYIKHFALVFFAATEPTFLKRRYLTRLLSWLMPSTEDKLQAKLTPAVSDMPLKNFTKAKKVAKKERLQRKNRYVVVDSPNALNESVKNFFKSNYYTDVLQSGFEAEVITP